MPHRSNVTPPPPDPATMARCLLVNLGIEDAEQFCEVAVDLLALAGQEADPGYWSRVGVLVTYFGDIGGHLPH